MSKQNDFISQEKDYYGKIFVDISYAIDNISPFLEKEELRNRKFAVKLPVLKKYIELLETAEAENKKSFFSKLFGSSNSEQLLQDYKRTNSESFKQLEKCSQCACLNCSATCSFDHCLGCQRQNRST